MNNKFIIIVVVITIALLGGIVVGAQKFGPNPEGRKSVEGGMVGKQAPDFELKDYEGNTVKLSDLRGKTVLLFFNEGLICYPACWDQMKALGEDERFSKDGVETYSVIVDVPDNWKKALDKMPELVKAKVLFDNTKSTSAAYETLYAPSSMHKGGYPGHTFVIVNKDGQVAYWWDDPKMGVRNNQLINQLEKIK